MKAIAGRICKRKHHININHHAVDRTFIIPIQNWLDLGLNLSSTLVRCPCSTNGLGRTAKSMDVTRYSPDGPGNKCICIVKLITKIKISRLWEQHRMLHEYKSLVVKSTYQKFEPSVKIGQKKNVGDHILVQCKSSPTCIYLYIIFCYQRMYRNRSSDNIHLATKQLMVKSLL